MIPFLAGATQTQQGAECLRETKEGKRIGAMVAKVEGGLDHLPLFRPDATQMPSDATAMGRPSATVLSYASGSAGSVLECDVIRSAGNAALDAQACALLRTHVVLANSHAPTKPIQVAVLWAPTAADSPVCTTNGGSLPLSPSSWITPDVFLHIPAQSGSALVTLHFGADGKVSRCAVPAADVDGVLQTSLCRSLSARARTLPLIANGEPQASDVSLVVRFALPSR